MDTSLVDVVVLDGGYRVISEFGRDGRGGYALALRLILENGTQSCSRDCVGLDGSV